MVERTVLGEKGSAQRGSRTTPAAPSASAVRQMVPTFPGSWSPSSTRYPPGARVSGSAVSGLRHREIARDLGLPLSTVLSRYSRALKKLKRCLSEEGVRL